MSNIEEDIKTMHKIISFYRYLDIINNNDKCEEIKAIENILSEREQYKKRIKELEEIDTANRKVIVEQCDYIQNKSIPVQKVKDKIEEYEEDIKDFEQTDNTGRFKRDNCILLYKKEALEELIGEINYES